MQTLKFRLAEHRDIPELFKVINSAYRQQHENSWTNESKIVEGDRIHQTQLEALIAQHTKKNPQSHLLIAELTQQAIDQLIGCVLIEYQQKDIEIGTFCIAPEWQNLGYGHRVLKAAEVYALKFKPELRSMLMWVLDIRHELIEFYIRRGYEKTGVIDHYPFDAGVGEPLCDLQIIQLRKTI